MSKRVVFRHMDHSQEIENFANQKMAKIDDFLTHEKTPITINLIMEPSKVHAHPRIEFRVTSPDFQVVVTHERQGEDFYEVLNYVIDTAYRELIKQKQRRVDDLRKGIKHGEFKD